ncbi:MAG TPA: uroporphyrinogen-III C-methyltransferase [Myxococcales bacterium]|nr:uroporphyrinogen-III C-methyltransferase [Myxococcales bacterium]
MTRPRSVMGGRLILVGAGPGDPDLITVRGAAALRRADVVLFDELASEELLSLLPAHAEKINVGKRGHDPPTRSQDDINRLIVEKAQTGKTVIRLKGGDPFIFGRGGEEASACVSAGVPFEVIPGVTSALAAPAYAGIPLTDRRYSASFAVVTGHNDPGKAAEGIRWRALGNSVDTLVILMGMRNLRSLLVELVDGGTAPETPAAAVMNGTRPEQKVKVATVSTLADVVEAASIKAPSVVVVGEVASLREELSWWEESPLFGLGALVSRAPHQAGELASALRAAGAVPSIRPLIDLVPTEAPADLVAIDNCLAGLHLYDDVVFSSSNSVRFFIHHLERNGLRGALGNFSARVLCIGAATSSAAMDEGLPVHFVLPGGQGDAESMLAEIIRSLTPANRRMLIPQSNIARDVLSQGLSEAGADVDAIVFYRNLRPDVDVDALRKDLVAGDLPLLFFTSPSAVRNFSELLDEPSRTAAERCIIAAVGTTTAQALSAAGLPAQVVPGRPDVREMVAAVEAYVAQERGSASLSTLAEKEES